MQAELEALVYLSIAVGSSVDRCRLVERIQHEAILHPPCFFKTEPALACRANDKLSAIQRSQNGVAAPPPS